MDPRRLPPTVAGPRREWSLRERAAPLWDPGRRPRADLSRGGAARRPYQSRPPRREVDRSPAPPGREARGTARRGHRLDQHGAAGTGRLDREGRPLRLLDVLLRELRPDAAVPQRLVRPLPTGRAGPRGSALTRVRLRTRAVKRRGRNQAPGCHLAGRPRQPDDHLELVPE